MRYYMSLIVCWNYREVAVSFHRPVWNTTSHFFFRTILSLKVYFFTAENCVGVHSWFTNKYFIRLTISKVYGKNSRGLIFYFRQYAADIFFITLSLLQPSCTERAQRRSRSSSDKAEINGGKATGDQNRGRVQWNSQCTRCLQKVKCSNAEETGI